MAESSATTSSSAPGLAGPAPAAATPAAPATPPAAASPPAAANPSPAVPQNTGILEVDDAHDGEDDDSALGVSSGDVSETASVVSSIFRYREQSGRTFHAYRDRTGTGSDEFIPYFLPNDESETERLDLQHNLVILTQDGQLYISPAGKDKPLKRVLDAGCGTGIWSIDFADENPETSVVGIDISPIQPSFVPPKVEFFVDDLELEWNYVNPFDFIYTRFMTGSLKNWPKFFDQAYKHLQPGGWIEICDIVSPIACDDGSMTDETPLLKWSKLLLEASENLGASLSSPQHYKQQMIDAGFQNVVQVDYKWPTNPWPKDPKHKEIGAWTQANIMQALQALSIMSFTKGLGWSVIEVETLLAQVRKDVKNKDVHAYWPIIVVYGQKPE
ncbi:S-adenosyl-L-methionine-dependent methyltransferase [Parathielavia appendiculata]|uniref:S-adenosyl-L-methionine-dependent methyltransferase n=1 Tax=Parathielavia appendiculata TaxID=2587402 RepID=A0AAN6Z0L9_9PEZI|nr:S-adenosyl-L-methionine-dependent methyltransferase [Parathielavia appendiculata]